jgi:hypothetical protein
MLHSQHGRNHQIEVKALGQYIETNGGSVARIKQGNDEEGIGGRERAAGDEGTAEGQGKRMTQLK